MLNNFLFKIKEKIRGNKTISELERNGFKHGSGLRVMQDCIIDPGHCMLIEFGDEVTLAPRVHILAHDASTKMHLGYTRICKTVLGDRVFIGAGSIVLPGVTIGDDVIVGAGSVVTKSLPSNGVYAGNPARKIMDTDEYIERQASALSQSQAVFDRSYTIDNADNRKISELANAIERAGGSGFIE